MPKFDLAGNKIEVVEEMRVLGLIIRSDLKWSSNTENMVKMATRDTGCL